MQNKANSLYLSNNAYFDPIRKTTQSNHTGFPFDYQY